MIEVLFQSTLMQYGLLTGMIVGLISPLVGVFLVVRRLSLISDALSHITLSGVALGLLLQKRWDAFQGINPLYFGMISAFIGSLFVEKLRKLYHAYQELAIPILLSGGVGLGVILISASTGFNSNITGYLFGSILAVGQDEIWMISIIGVIVLIFFFLFYKEMFALSFDEEQSVLSGISHRLVNILFMVIVALVISAAIRVVGLLLISALITIPVAASLQFTNSFRQTVIWSIVFSQLSVCSGFVASYYLDWPSGGTIVLVSIFILLMIFCCKWLMQKWSLRKRWS